MKLMAVAWQPFSFKARVEFSQIRFNVTGDKQGNAVWVWEGSSVIISGNKFGGFHAAVNASKAILTVTRNSITRFQRIAITVKDSLKPAHIYGNRATTADRQAKVIEMDGPAGVVDLNELTYEQKTTYINNSVSMEKPMKLASKAIVHQNLCPNAN